jgi:hypothetical protein
MTAPDAAPDAAVAKPSAKLEYLIRLAQERFFSQEYLQARGAKLTEGERKLLAAIAADQMAGLGGIEKTNFFDGDAYAVFDPAEAMRSWGDDAALHSDFLRWLCQDVEVRPYVGPRGVQIMGALIKKRGPSKLSHNSCFNSLDLSSLEINFDLGFHCCVIPLEISFWGSKARLIAFHNAHTGPINATGLEAEHFF